MKTDFKIGPLKELYETGIWEKLAFINIFIDILEICLKLNSYDIKNLKVIYKKNFFLKNFYYILILYKKR